MSRTLKEVGSPFGTYLRVEQRGMSPARVDQRYNLDIADVYKALAYYYNNPEEMKRVEKRHEQAIEAAKRRSSSPTTGK